MPNFDKTGPEGKGENTGLGRGNCAGGNNQARPCLGKMGGRFSIGRGKRGEIREEKREIKDEKIENN